MSEILEYTCPCCGGSIEFNSRVQKLKCPYCDTEFETDTLQQYDTQLGQEQSDSLDWNTQDTQEWQPEELGTVRDYTCKTCGAMIMTAKTTSATACPYCGNPVVLLDRLSGTLRPDLVVPFQLDKKAAKDGMARHLQGKRLLPKVFKDEQHLEEIQGIYVPFWLFQADADANMRYRASRSHSWQDHNYRYTETLYYSVHRSGSLSFDPIPVDGSKKMEDDLMESLEPYDLTKAVDFQTAYLAGYLADRYDVTARESEPRANERVKRSTEQVFADTVTGYETVLPEHSSVHLRHGRTSYALLPVWLLTTTWRGETYTFAMNGQTGKFIGNLPMDRGVFFRMFTLVALLGTAATYLLAWLMHLLL